MSPHTAKQGANCNSIKIFFFIKKVLILYNANIYILFKSTLYYRVPKKELFFVLWQMEKPNKNTDFPEFNLIAKRLRELRLAKGYKSYEHIAFDLGMSRSAYWKLENASNFELKTLIKVCRVLDISLEEFFRGIDMPSLKQ